MLFLSKDESYLPKSFLFLLFNLGRGQRIAFVEGDDFRLVGKAAAIGFKLSTDDSIGFGYIFLRAIDEVEQDRAAFHVAEEARHISFAHSYLGRSVPGIPRFDRFLLSLYVPIVMRMLCGAFLVLPRSFFAQLGIPRGVRRQAFFGDPASRQMLQDMYGDIRMLCYEVDLMNPAARLMWRACRIGGRPSRYRGEPSRHLADAI